MDLAERFARHVRAQPLLPAGARVLVACSGGADSTALAALTAGVAAGLGLRDVALAHLDHGLRPGSREDLEAVRALAAELGVGFLGRREPVVPQRGESPEEAARRVRYTFLADAACERGAGHVLTAHHKDDQAETVLLRLVRGTGPAGLAGIRETRTLVPGVDLVRPLLPFRREELREWLRERGRTWREDPTNADGNERARLRATGLPALAASTGRDPVPPLARLAELCADLREPESSAVAEAFVDLQGDRVRLAPGFERLPRALRAGTLRRHVPALRGGGPLTRDEVERLLAALDGEDAGEVAGIAVDGSADGPVLSPAPGSARPGTAIAAAWPGATTLFGGRTLTVEIVPAGNRPFLERLSCRDGRVELADADRIVPPLVIRCRTEGDRMRPLGASSDARLGHVLQRRGVPARDRDAVPLLCDTDGVVWAGGVVLADRVRVRADTRRIAILRIT